MTSYRYRPHLLWARNACFGLLIGLAAIVLATMTIAGYWAVGVFLAVLILGEAWLIKYVFNRLISVQVTTNESAILYTSRQRNIQMAYHQIKKLRFPSAKYVGGWVKISSESESIRLTVVLEGIADFLRDLKAGLDRQPVTIDYDEKKLFNFFKTAAYSDQSWARLYDIFWRLLGAHILAVFVGIMLTSLVHPDAPFAMKGLIGIMSSFWVTGVYVYTEQSFVKIIEKQANPTTWTYPPRDRTYEAQVYRKGMVWGGLIYAIAMVSYLTLQAQ